MLFWKLTVKAKIYILIQRGKLRADRETTHGMLGLWSWECMKIKSQCDIFSFVLLNLWNSYENRDNVKFVGRSKHYLEISKTWERLVCSSLLRSSSAAMKIEMAGFIDRKRMLGIFLGIEGKSNYSPWLPPRKFMAPELRPWNPQGLFHSARLTNPARECSGAKMYYNISALKT